MLQRPELLSPAGDWECARAAVANGADAVYFGLTRFNARLRAQNFTEGDLPELMAFLHRHGVRGFVTFNTLIFTNELDDAEKQLRLLAGAGVDAIIVQDLGLARLAQEIAPGLEVHASTQMTITSPEGLELAKELGIRRAVLARELSLRELQRFQAAGVPVEVFVHGALCVAYSGQCLTSESLGQRSANRGECAQACRLPYELTADGKRVDLGDRKYLLSPQDLAGIEEVPELIRLGVARFKIEGRLKSPEYVAAVTQVYRGAIDRAYEALVNGQPVPEVSWKDRYALEMTFSRGLFSGWLHGVNHQRLVDGTFGKKRGPFLGTVARVGPDYVELSAPSDVKPGDGVVFGGAEDTEHEEGGRVFEVVRGQRLYFGNGKIDFRRIKPGNRVWKTDDPVLNRRLRQTFGSDRNFKPAAEPAVDMLVAGEAGKPLTLTVRVATAETGQPSVTVASAAVLAEARSSPLTAERLRDQLGRLGGTGFRLGDLRCDLQGNLFAPPSLLNELRREAMTRLAEVIRNQGAASQQQQPRGSAPARSVTDLLRPRQPARGPDDLSVLCRTWEQVEAACDEGTATVYVDFEDVRRYREAVRDFGSRCNLFLATPRIQKPGEAGFFRLIENAGPHGILVRNLGAIMFFRNKGFRLHGDFSLNVANPLTAEFLLAQGLDRLTISYDLNLVQVLTLLSYRPAERFELTLHQHMPMFHMEHCVFAAFLSQGRDYTDCGRPCDRHRLRVRDRVGAEHPVLADAGCRNTVFNAQAQSGAAFFSSLHAAGLRLFRIECLEENRDQTRDLIREYRRLLAGEIAGDALWCNLRVQSQLGVTHGTLK
jgi:putative protease